jgi:hypothetical protein
MGQFIGQLFKISQHIGQLAELIGQQAGLPI